MMNSVQSAACFCGSNFGTWRFWDFLAYHTREYNWPLFLYTCCRTTLRFEVPYPTNPQFIVHYGWEEWLGRPEKVRTVHSRGLVWILRKSLSVLCSFPAEIPGDGRIVLEAVSIRGSSQKQPTVYSELYFVVLRWRKEKILGSRNSNRRRL